MKWPINELLIATCAVVMILLPVNAIQLTGSYFVLFFIIVFVLGSKFGFRLVPAIVFSLVVMAGLLIVEIASRGFGWHLREYVLPLTWCIFLLNIPRIDLTVVLNAVLVLAGAAIVLDFLSLYLGVFPEIAESIRELTYGGDIRDYWDRYWRHAGIRGNPNSSAFLYGTYIVIYSFVVTGESTNTSRMSMWVLHLVAAISLVLLVAAESRTNLIATGVLASVSVLGMKSARIKYLLLVLIASVVIYFYMGFQVIVERFSSFSSGVARIQHWDGMLSTMDGLDMIVGRPLPFGFTDSDYLYIFTRYGSVGSAAFCLVVFWVWMSSDRSNPAGRLARQLFAYAIIAGIAMGVLVSPNDAAFVFLLVSACIASAKLDSNDAIDVQAIRKEPYTQ